MTLFRSIGAALDDDGTGTEPIDVRKDLAALFTGPGVLPGGSSPLVEGSAGWAYTVHAGAWVTSRGASDGVHLWGNDGDVSVGTGGVGTTVGVAPGSGLKRIDIIYALHPSNNENADETSAPTVAVASGTAASIAIPPTLPTGALELGRNEMTSAATSTASAGNTISQTTARVGAVTVPTDTGWLALTSLQAGWTAPAGAWRVRRRGDAVWIDGVQRNNGGVIAAGTYTVGSLPGAVGVPSVTAYLEAIAWVSGGTDGRAEVIVTSAGVVQVVVFANTTGVRIHAPVLVV